MDRYRISLRLCHPTRPAAALCADLPFIPDRTWDVGAPRTTAKGNPLPGRNDETYCLFPLDEGGGRVAEAVAVAAERVAPYCDRFASWRAEGGRIEFFVGWFIETGNSGDEFEPELLVRLGELGIRLSLDVYATDSD